MSICRFAKIGQPTGWFNEDRHDESSESDVYMYEHVDDFIACQECKLGGSVEHPGTMDCVKLKDYSDAHKHLLAHRAAGHRVPQFAIDVCKRVADAGIQVKDRYAD